MPNSRRDATRPHDDAVIKPFRWNLARREQLGALTDGDTPPLAANFLTELRTVAAKVVASDAASRFVFVGRSPEPLFDYLSGLFHDVSGAPPLTLLHFSNRGRDIADLVREHPADVAALQRYFDAEDLGPHAIASAERMIRFVDVVSGGGTFGSLAGSLHYWARETQADWHAVRRRIGFIGLTWQTHTSPNTWRWWQHQDWVEDFRSDQIFSVSVPGAFWGAIANSHEKVTPSHHVDRWADERALSPSHRAHHLAALRHAVQLFDLGRTGAERAAFVRQLTGRPQMSERALRDLVLQLRRTGS